MIDELSNKIETVVRDCGIDDVFESIVGYALSESAKEAVVKCKNYLESEIRVQYEASFKTWESDIDLISNLADKVVEYFKEDFQKKDAIISLLDNKEFDLMDTYSGLISDQYKLSMVDSTFRKFMSEKIIEIPQEKSNAEFESEIFKITEEFAEKLNLTIYNDNKSKVNEYLHSLFT
ncbi:hypothetical protein HOK51_08800 [Candidatus Woesearchaeota archaeon]|jgi:hypothetical protein|nr:hypothetical protein [Candidatus Woesearchaeota archaeon]MBT6519926.1 hypothetical protein [Candidatus Woesearchaeota archaeon]MBT7367098.1 hypothetical protein [Candidatus Woesearchaeota archaeon]